MAQVVRYLSSFLEREGSWWSIVHLLTDIHVGWMVYGGFNKKAHLLLLEVHILLFQAIYNVLQASRAHGQMRGRKTPIRCGQTEWNGGWDTLPGIPMPPSHSTHVPHGPISSWPLRIPRERLMDCLCMNREGDAESNPRGRHIGTAPIPVLINGS
jgi:hypothetical protein